MNLNALETLARKALKGENVTEKSNVLLKSGFLSPAEHRSLNSLSWQIAANVSANGAAATSYAAAPQTVWI